MRTPVQHAETSSLIQAAIVIVGSEAKLGRAVGVSQNAIWQAKSKGRVSAELAAGIHRATNGAIPKHRLRPDLYDAPADRIGKEAA